MPLDPRLRFTLEFHEHWPDSAPAPPWPTPDHDEVALRVQVIRDCDLEVAGLRVHLEAAVRGLGGLVVWPPGVTP